jgi:hypothetical protein
VVDVATVVGLPGTVTAAAVVVVAGPDTGRQLWLDGLVCDPSGATPTTVKQWVPGDTAG